MKTKKILVVFLLVLFSLNLLVLINTVKATNYEWLLNNSFEDGIGTEQVINGNFESGITNGWNTQYSTTYVNTEVTNYTSATTGIWILHFTGNYYIQYNFTSPIAVGNVQSMSIQAMSAGATARTFRFVIYYTDGTDSGQITGNENRNSISNAFTAVNLLNCGYSLVSGKYIATVRFYVYDATFDQYFDDFSLKIFELGQTDITQNTLPWYSSKLGIDSNVNATIKTDFGHYGNSSYYNWVSSYQSLSVLNRMTIQQDVNFLSTNNITTVSLWVYCGSNTKTTIQFVYSYSDGSLSTGTKSFYSYNRWTLLDFTNNKFSNKNLIKISFTVIEGSGAIWIDDISILANVNLGSSETSWLLTPTPYYYNSTYFQGYMYTTYQFTGSIYSPSGLLTENGTFTVTSQKGFAEGNMTFGVISFTIAQRTKVDNFDEIFVIVVNVLGVSARTLILTINAHWFADSPLQGTPTPTPTGFYGGNSNAQPAIGVSFFGGLIVTLALAVTFGAIAGRDGLIGGLAIGIFLASISGLFPIYGLIFAVIFGVLLIVSHTGIPNTGTNTGAKQ